MPRRLALLAAAATLHAAVAAATETVSVRERSGLHQSPSTTSAVLLVLEPGTTVESHGERAGWVNVDVPGSGSAPPSRGWLPRDAVGPVAADDREPKED